MKMFRAIIGILGMFYVFAEYLTTCGLLDYLEYLQNGG